MVRSRRPLAALILALVMAAPSAARADAATVARAQALFDEALGLMKEKKYAEACPKLEESNHLDPGMGTQYRLAECYESAGKIVSAWTIFRNVADEAQREGQGERAAVAIKRAAALAPRLPMLFVEVPESARQPGLTVKIDGNLLPPSDWDRKVPVDPGEHLLAVRAPKRVGWVRSLSLLEGSSTTIVVPALLDASAPPPLVAKAPPPAVDAPPPARAGLSTPRVAALAIGGVGALGLVVGAVFGVRAGSQWSSAKDTCGDPIKGETCTPAGVQLGKDASASAALSTLGFVVGGAALLTGTVLWFRFAPPKPHAAASNFTLAPAFGPGSGGARLEGSF